MAASETISYQKGKKPYGIDAFSRLSSYEWYGTADDNEAKKLRLSAKADFLANQDVRYPQLRFPMLDALDMEAVERSYQSILAELETSEAETEASERSYEQAARKLAELYRHKEITRRLGWSANTALSRERAGLMTIELFGEVDQDDFAHLIRSLRTQAASIADISPEASELLQMTNDVETLTDQPSYEISKDAVETLREDFYELFPGLEAAANNSIDDAANLEQKIAYIQQLIDCVCGEGVAKLCIVDGTVAASTNVVSREITVGNKRLAGYSGAQCLKTAVHEAIGHMIRGLRAENQEDSSLRQTQTGNLAFEEGLATAIEQIISGETRIAGEQYYLSLGFQLGLDREGKKRDFRDTFEIMWRRIMVEAIADGNVVAKEDARNKAYTQLMRTNRGGALDARDISYFQGSKYAYPWINDLSTQTKAERQRTLRVALSGRFDATRQDQWQSFEQSYTNAEAA